MAEEEVTVKAAELGFMQRHDAGMAWLVVKLHEDHRMCKLGGCNIEVL